MISTTSLLGWTGRPDRAKNPSTNTATTKPADSETSSYAELAAKYEKQSEELATLKAGSVAGLPSGAATTAGDLDPTRLASLLAGGRSGVGGSSPFTPAGLDPRFSSQQGVGLGTPVSSQQSGAVGSSIPTGPELSPSGLLA
jgi:hypothetical protein